MSVFVRNSMASAKAGIRETGAKAGESGGMKSCVTRTVLYLTFLKFIQFNFQLIF